MLKYNSEKDVWATISRIKKEAKNHKNSSSNSIIKDVFYQIPFFACYNLFIDNQMQKDIAKYLYCEDTKTPPYSGSYGENPKMWLEKHFIIKQALSILYQEKRDENKLKHGK